MIRYVSFVCVVSLQLVFIDAKKGTKLTLSPGVIRINEGDTALARLPVDENVLTCILVNNENGTKYNLSNETKLVQRYGQCGVRLKKVNKTQSGRWYLQATAEGGKKYYGEFVLYVQERRSNLVDEETRLVLRGRENYKLELETSSIYCELVDPFDNLVQKTRGSCSYEIPLMTSYEEGTWVMRYHVQGVQEMLYKKIYLKLLQSPMLNSSVIYAEDGKIHLQCTVLSEKEEKEPYSCFFEHPNSTRIAVYPGQGIEDYEYFADKPESQNTQTCGITIRHPVETDYGTWRCLMKRSTSSTPIGSVIDVGNFIGNRTINNRSVRNDDKIYVKRGDSFKISCKTNAKLNSCWVKSPNGTIHHTDERNRYPALLRYEGAGFSLGECTVIVPDAQEYHAGEWQCHMDDGELNEESRVFVVVTELYIMPVREKVRIDAATTPVTLSCVPIPGGILDIDDCWWIKPTGDGIHYEPDDRYRIEIDYQHCKLHLRDVGEDDNGHWICMVRPATEVERVYQAGIDVWYAKNEGNNLLVIALSSCAVGMVLACLSLLAIRYRSRRSTSYSQEKDRHDTSSNEKNNNSNSEW